ncbi:MAG: hypothetical protein K8F91_02940 [Candidatus Obscuribacterales bacterium]|nr:hypothetical protein [Candidatus Obscuribacterales bacterium]
MSAIKARAINRYFMFAGYAYTNAFDNPVIPIASGEAAYTTLEPARVKDFVRSDLLF